MQFVKFANIEEDTPSYHRSYDFFVSRFSEMCHSEHDDHDVQNKSVLLRVSGAVSSHRHSSVFSPGTLSCRIRVSGIRGLQGVVRKTVDDELQVNIWEPRHMEQIVPALLVNLQRCAGHDRCARRNAPGARRLLSRVETRLNSVGCFCLAASLRRSRLRCVSGSCWAEPLMDTSTTPSNPC